jgi:hypothetical protein
MTNGSIDWVPAGKNWESEKSSSLCITFGAIILGLELLWFKTIEI